MTLREFINLFPENLDEYIEGISYEGGEDDFELDLCIRDDGLSICCKLCLFNDRSAGIYDISCYEIDNGDISDTKYIPIKFVDIVEQFVNTWRSLDEN